MPGPPCSSAATVAAAAREIAQRMEQTVADRRWYHLFRGRRPQEFGRYRTVKDALVRDGVPAQAITVVGMGEKGLLVPTGDNVREPQNRRVEIVIQ